MVEFDGIDARHGSLFAFWVGKREEGGGEGGARLLGLDND